LAPQDRALLQAAVIGRRFDPQLLAAALTVGNIDPQIAAMQAPAGQSDGGRLCIQARWCVTRALSKPAHRFADRAAPEDRQIERRSSNRLAG
jgi:hypothetical protein